MTDFPDPELLAYSPDEDRRDNESVAEWVLRLSADRPSVTETRLHAARFVDALRRNHEGDEDAPAQIEDTLKAVPTRQLVLALAGLALCGVETLERDGAVVRPASTEVLKKRFGSEPGWLLRARIDALTRLLLREGTSPGPEH